MYPDTQFEENATKNVSGGLLLLITDNVSF